VKYLKVTATSFGPLQGEELEFGPGLNVVVGPNEARKSSWHSAMYAGLCGRRRGKGRAAGDDKAFEDRHRPWNGETWAVRAEVSLDDGRTIELRHDLAGRRSEVVDLEFGRPVEDDIVFEGNPDGSRWLGLDRRTFLATACVRQAEILAVADDPDGLRELLQRAASTLGGDMTAASAIEMLTAFRRDHVGRDQANSVRPLRKAKLALQHSSERHDQCVESHSQYQRLVAQVDQAANEAHAAETELAAAIAGERREAELAELAELDKTLSVADLIVDAATNSAGEGDLEAVREALAQWSVTIVPRALTGQTAAEIGDEIADLPVAPNIDGELDSHMSSLVEHHRDAASILRSHKAGVPEAVPVEDIDQAVEVAKTASAPPPVAPPGLAADRNHLPSTDDAAQRANRALMAKRVAAAAGLGAILVALTGAVVVAVVMGLAAVGLAAVGSTLSRSLDGGSSEQTVATAREIEAYEAAVADQEEAARVASHWLSQRGLSADPAEVAVTVASRRVEREFYERWLAQCEQLADAEAAAAQAVLDTLEKIGIRETLIDEAVARYARLSEETRSVAQARAVLPQLVERERLREAAEIDYQLQLTRRSSAARLLIDAVEALGASASDATIAAEIAERMIDDQDNIRRAALATAKMDAELAARLDGRNVEEVRIRRGELIDSLRDVGERDDVTSTPDVDGARARKASVDGALAQATAMLGAVSAESIDTAATAAAVEAAGREVERVEQLGATLDLTRTYLEAAQAEAYRAVAPRVAADLNANLGRLTAGRYTDAKVDPEELNVRVRDVDGVFRDADRLSHGTAEQIHLLLRLAMVRTLTAPDESCPLLIDDPTVHADRTRTEAVLDVLLELAADRQIVLFSQEDQVREWAVRNLDGPANRIIDLEVA